MEGEDTHYKKRLSTHNSKFIAKGMTPIEKNILVVDEQGNAYEATYPKRAKGLVKNGRARFISENTICLACPPKEYLEDNKMSENKKLTAREIFEEIKNLQIQLTENRFDSIHRLDDALTTVLSENQFESDEARIEAINQVKGVFTLREATYQQREENIKKLLEIYQKMYEDLQPKSKRESDRVTVLKSVIETLGDGLTPVESKEALRDVLTSALTEY